MLGIAMHTTIETLIEKGMNKSQIARATGHDWKTVSKVVESLKQGKGYPKKKPHPGKLNPHKEKIVEMLEKGLSGVRIHEELIREGISVGYTTVTDYIRNIKVRENIFVRIHTEPAEEAQVDFGYVGLTTDDNGKRRKTWVFNMRLSYSRLDYYQKVYDQKVETFIRCHINAFRYFGGVPETVRIDNLKAAILEANFYEPVYQRLYRDFAEFYGFKPIPCRIYHPNDKGKVESGVKYVKNNFFAGRSFTDGKELDTKLRYWQENKCNSRIHGTTRRVPREVFEEEEKEKLIKLPEKDFRLYKAGTRKVYHDCHIFIEYNYYSVPFEYVGKEVDIELSRNLLKVYYEGRQIALHPRLKRKGKFSTEESHYPKYKRYSKTEYQEKYQAKMSNLGQYAEQMFFIIIKRQPDDWNRTVKGIINLSKKYPAEIVNLACKRALLFGVSKYSIIKNICKNGSYNLPVEFNRERVENECFKEKITQV